MLNMLGIWVCMSSLTADVSGVSTYYVVYGFELALPG
jgi:hypothetical protein